VGNRNGGKSGSALDALHESTLAAIFTREDQEVLKSLERGGFKVGGQEPSVLVADYLAETGRVADATAYLAGGCDVRIILAGPQPTRLKQCPPGRHGILVVFKGGVGVVLDRIVTTRSIARDESRHPAVIWNDFQDPHLYPIGSRVL
jgi:hypothetical protein